MNNLFNHILSFPPWLVLLLVFLVPAAESSMFLGFFFPGEISIILGGVLANEHVLPLWSVAVVGSLGSIVGDSIGYSVGHRFGPGLLKRLPRRIVKPESIERGKELLRRRGGQAVFIGRFTVALRVLIPGMAGASGLRYSRFLLFNILGGVAWATETAIFGYLAGRGYQAAAHRLTQASIILLALVLLGFLVVSIRRRRRQVSPPVPSKKVGQWGWWAARFRKDSQTGLGLTLAVLGVLASGWIFGGIFEDITDTSGTSLSDFNILNFADSHRTGLLTLVAKICTYLGSSLVVYAALILAGIYVWRRTERWRGLIFAGVSLALGQLIRFGVVALTLRDRPPHEQWLTGASGYSFPSGNAVTATIGFGLLAYLTFRLALHTWQKVAAIIAAVIIAVLVGLSRVYLGVHWMSDVIGGWSFGLLWLSIVLGASTVWRLGEGQNPKNYANIKP